jgi:hypothetical protein
LTAPDGASQSSSPPTRPWREIGLVLAAGLGLAAIFFRRLLFTDGLFVDIDHVIIQVPIRAFIERAIDAGEVPLWNHDAGMGSPFLPHGDVGLFYPLQPFFFVMDHTRALGWELWLHAGLTVTTMYAFCRVSLRTSPAAALTGGVVFAFGGYLLSHTGFLSFIYGQAWVPLLFLALERSVERSLRWAALGSVAVAVSVLSGQPQHLVLGALWAPLFVLAIVLRAPTARRFRSAVLSLVIGIGGGAALAGIQLLPQAEFVGESARGRSYSVADANFGALPTDVARHLLWPDFAGRTFGEFAGWIGVTGIVLVLAGLVTLLRRRRWPEVGLWAAMAGVSFVLALGSTTPLFRIAYEVVPAIDRFRFPVRWLFPMTIALAALAAYGTDELLAFARGRGGLGRMTAALGIAAGIVVVATGSWGALLDAWDERRHLWVASVIAGAALVAAVVAGTTGRLRRRTAGGLVVGAVVLELFGVSGFLGWNRPGPSDYFSRERAIPAHIQDRDGGRVLPGAALFVPDWATAPDQLAANTPLLYGIRTVDIVGGAYPLRRAYPFTLRVHGALMTDDRSIRDQVGLWRGAGVEWVVGSPRQHNLGAVPELEKVKESGAFVLYRLRDPGPRVRGYCGARFERQPDRIERAVLAPNFAFDELLVEGEGKSVGSSECGRARVVGEGVNSLTVEVTLPDDGWLCVAETWYPGWEAAVDGRRESIREANAFFRAVRVPAGRHFVEFRYEPDSYRNGLALTATALLAGATWFLIAFSRTAPSPPHGPDRDAVTHGPRHLRRPNRRRRDSPTTP